jgi:hypothetical protein
VTTGDEKSLIIMEDDIIGLVIVGYLRLKK